MPESDRLIRTASSTWWWPGMKLMTNGPYLRPYLLPGGWSRYRGGHPWIIDAAAHMKVGMLDLRGIGSSRDDHKQATRR